MISILFLDLILGIAASVYGGLVSGAVIEAATVLAYGWVLILSSVVGLSAFASTCCERCGFCLSAFFALIIMVAEVGFGVAMMADTDGFIQFLRDNEDALYLTDETIDFVEDNIMLFCIIFWVLAFLEFCRYCTMCSLSKQSAMSEDMENDLQEPLMQKPTERGIQKIPESGEFTSDAQTQQDREKHWSDMLNNPDDSSVAKSAASHTTHTSEEDFAPVDEPLYTDSNWWATSEKDTENDMSWVTTPSDKLNKPDIV